MRNYKTTGVVIKRNNYSEADRIVTVFTKHFGKLRILAKGVRRIKSRRSGNIELFNLANITLHSGSKIDLLSEAEVINSYQFLKKDLYKVGWAYHLCELIDGFCAEGVDYQKTYSCLIKTLEHLDSAKDNIPGAIAFFETNLLQELGFWPHNETVPEEDSDKIIESILEKKLKAKKFIKNISCDYKN